MWSVPGLLLHLCIFHAYITLHDMTTYEYVRAQRQAADQAHREAALAQAPATEPAEEEEEGAGSRCECSLGAGRGNRVAPAHTNNKKVSSHPAQTQSFDNYINLITIGRMNVEDMRW